MQNFVLVGRKDQKFSLQIGVVVKVGCGSGVDSRLVDFRLWIRVMLQIWFGN